MKLSEVLPSVASLKFSCRCVTGKMFASAHPAVFSLLLRFVRKAVRPGRLEISQQQLAANSETHKMFTDCANSALSVGQCRPGRDGEQITGVW